MSFRPTLGVVKKNAPTISDPNLKRIVDTIYKDINDISDAVNLPSGTHTFLPRDGEPGDIRLYEGSGTDGSTGYFLQGRFVDGWATQRLTLETTNPDNQETATETTGVSGDYITAAGVTKYNLGNNGDIGTNSSQVSQGDHNHNHDDLANIDPDEHRQPSTTVTSTTLSQVAGAADLWSRGDHVHDIDLAIIPVWTGMHQFGQVRLYTSSVGTAQGHIDMSTTNDLIIDTTRLRITDPLLELGYGTTANSQIDGGGIRIEAFDSTAFTNNVQPSIYFGVTNSAWQINQKLGVNTGDPVRFLGIQDSVNPQLRLINDSTHYVDLQADSTSPIGNLLINPGHTQSSNVILGVQNAVPPTYGTTLKLNGAQSQTKGWQIDYLGGADFRYVYTDELHAKAFIADLEQALAGGQIIAKSVAVLAEDWVAVDAGSVTNGSTRPHIILNDLPSASGMRVFAENDWIRVRQFARGTTNFQESTQYQLKKLDNGLTLTSYTSDSTSDALRGYYAFGDASAQNIKIDQWTSGDVTLLPAEVRVIALYLEDSHPTDMSEYIDRLKEGAILKITATGSAWLYGSADAPYYFQVESGPRTAHEIHASSSNKIWQINVKFLPGLSNDYTGTWSLATSNYEATLDLGDGESGELLIGDAWGQVEFVEADSENNTQTWKFDRPADPNGGHANGTIKAESIVLDYGVPGNGFYEVNAIDGANAKNSPYSQIVTWETGTNQITNSEFTDPAVDDYWNLWVDATGGSGALATMAVRSSGGFSGPRYVEVDIEGAGNSEGDIQLFQDGGMSIISGVDYYVEFAAKYTAEGKVLAEDTTISARAIKHTTPYTNYGLDFDVVVTPDWQVFKTTFTANATDSNVRLDFHMGAGISSPVASGKVSFDFISFYQNTGPGTANAQTVRTRQGQLKGIFGQDEFGLYAGSGSTNSDQFFRISDKNFDIHNINLTMHSGAATTIKLDSGVPYFAIGSTVTDGTWSSGDKGFLARYDATEGAKVYIGQQDGHYIKWGDTAGKLEMKGSITIVDPSDDDHYAQVSAGYFETFHSGTRRARFGADVRIGEYADDKSRLEVDSSGNLEIINRQGTTDTTAITLSTAGVLTVAGAPNINGSNVTTINGSNITTGIIQSANWSGAGTQISLTDGTINTGGTSSPKFQVAADGTVDLNGAALTGGTITGQLMQSNYAEGAVTFVTKDLTITANLPWTVEINGVDRLICDRVVESLEADFGESDDLASSGTTKSLGMYGHSNEAVNTFNRSADTNANSNVSFTGGAPFYICTAATNDGNGDNDELVRFRFRIGGTEDNFYAYSKTRIRPTAPNRGYVLVRGKVGSGGSYYTVISKDSSNDFYIAGTATWTLPSGLTIYAFATCDYEDSGDIIGMQSQWYISGSTDGMYSGTTGLEIMVDQEGNGSHVQTSTTNFGPSVWKIYN